MEKKAIIRRLKGRVRRLHAKLLNNGEPAQNTSLPCRFNVDSPTSGRLDERRITVSGWVIPEEGHSIRAMRVVHNGMHDLPFGQDRPDVLRAFPDKGDAALHSGFTLELDVADAPLVVEIDLGNGFKELYVIELRYAPEKLVSDYYNPDLAGRYAEHQNLIDNRKVYNFEDSPTEQYERNDQDPRLVAYYLPQYHPLKANDLRFGKGFNEWTNVTGATPRFVGHQQPLLPRDLGFYDLRYADTIREQIDMAKQHGIYGFCFYYYWFSGSRVLERPMDIFLEHVEWDFNFMICWANENWTKQWDGSNKDIFIAQRYEPEDPLKFIKDVEHVLLDPRYMTEDGKPILAVYRPMDLKDPARWVKVWRDYFKKHHNKELHLVCMLSYDETDPRSFGFDKAIDFAPQTGFFKNECFTDGRYPYLNVHDKLIDPFFEGTVADYRQLALNDKQYDFFDFPTYKTVIPGWDNDPRQNKRKKGFVCYNTSPDLYGRWLDKVLEREAKTQKSPLVFLNAWNEWGEGAVLEPSLANGRAILNRTTQVLATHSGTAQNRRKFPLYGNKRAPSTELAVLLHLYYPDKWQAVRQRLERLTGTTFDLFVTINEKDQDVVDMIKKSYPKASIYVVPNRGRDVLPFVHFGRRIEQSGYKYLLKIHTKKSKHRSDGTEWFDSLLDSIMPSKDGIQRILKTLETSPTIVGPKGHFVSLQTYMGADEPHLRRLLSATFSADQASKVLANPSRYGYFAGTMFWVRLDAIKPLLDMYLMAEDFPPESGQIDGTLAHGIERTVSLLPQLQGKSLYQVSPDGDVTKVQSADIETHYKYAP